MSGKPKFWRVHWKASMVNGKKEPAGFADFLHRARANGFVIIRRALGYSHVSPPLPQRSNEPVNLVRD